MSLYNCLRWAYGHGGLRAIVISHLHHDYSGGLKDLVAAAPKIPIYISNKYWETFRKHPFHATVEGCAPENWPKDFNPNILQLQDRPIVIIIYLVNHHVRSVSTNGRANNYL